MADEVKLPPMTEQEMKKYHAWQRRVQVGLPQLATRVFALRTKMYAGCGFHYGMEKALGLVIKVANDYENTPKDWAHAIIDEVLVQNLFNDIVKAEKSAVEWEKRNAESVRKAAEGDSASVTVL